MTLAALLFQLDDEILFRVVLEQGILVALDFGLVIDPVLIRWPLRHANYNCFGRLEFIGFDDLLDLGKQQLSKPEACAESEQQRERPAHDSPPITARRLVRLSYLRACPIFSSDRRSMVRWVKPVEGSTLGK